MPTNPELLKMPFAQDGDKNSIPETTSPTTGLFSQQYGFQSINSLPLTAGGKAISRLDYNGAMYMLSNLLYYMQRGYTFVYDNTMPYVVGCRVLDPNDGQVYNCVADVAAGVGAPSVTPGSWELAPSADVLGFRKPNTAYKVGQIAYHATLPTGWYLECTTPGITSSGDLSISSTTIGDTVTDGTVTWTICKEIGTGNVPLVAGFNAKQTFTSSGTFTPTVTGNYKITLQGGGGGGSGSGSYDSSTHFSGAGGGQGGHGIVYEKLVAGTTYSFTIGAGGAGGTAGTSSTFGTVGSNGGDTSITINDSVYTATGGTRGNTSSGVWSRGGAGGHFKINDSIAPVPFGIAGGSGTAGSGTRMEGGCGGGGAAYYSNQSYNGGGGAGGQINGSFSAGGNGGDGYITFEWQTASLV